MQMLRDSKNAHRPLPYKIKRFWFNSFEELSGAHGHTAEAASLAALAGNEAALRSWADAMSDDATKAVLASVGQGRGVRDIVNLLGLEGNRPINGLAVAGNDVYDMADLKVQVVGPLPDQIADLQEKWLAAPKGKKAELVAYLDKSTPNLSSIVCLVQHEGRKLLLTGDARGDYVLQGLEEYNLFNADGTLKLDLLKLPHHGSNRNIAPDFFKRLPADHYVISADGTYDNPDESTLEMLIEAREVAEYTIHITNELPWMEDFFAEKAEGRSFTVDYRGKNDNDHITIEL
jgi:hypothetical protein